MPRPKINVAHFLSSRIENLSGGDLVILNLLKRLDGGRFDSWIICFNEERNPGEPLIIKTARSRGIKTFMIDTRGRFDPRPINNLRTFIRENKIDVLHCHGYKADVIGILASKGTGIKKITTFHGWWIGRSPKLNFYNWLDIYAMKRFDRIIVVSDPMMEVLKNSGVPEAKLLCIPNCVDIDEVGKAAGNIAKEELRLPDNKIIIGIAGRLSGEKGHKYLFSAIKDIEGVILLVVGNGPLEQRLKYLAEALRISDKVVFAGFRPNVTDYIAAMDIFVLPSLTEGLPLALLEAMAAAKPVIASEVGGIPTVIENRKTGLLVTPRNPDLLKKAILSLINDRNMAKELALNARKLAEIRFSLEKMTESYEKIYSEVCGISNV